MTPYCARICRTRIGYIGKNKLNIINLPNEAEAVSDAQRKNRRGASSWYAARSTIQTRRSKIASLSAAEAPIVPSESEQCTPSDCEPAWTSRTNWTGRPALYQDNATRYLGRTADRLIETGPALLAAMPSFCGPARRFRRRAVGLAPSVAAPCCMVCRCAMAGPLTDISLSRSSCQRKLHDEMNKASTAQKGRHRRAPIRDWATPG